jgi:hypothetical protein
MPSDGEWRGSKLDLVNKKTEIMKTFMLQIKNPTVFGE